METASDTLCTNGHAVSTSLSRTVVRRIGVSVFTIPTDQPESDGTLEWDSTTLVVVEIEAGGQTGMGYTYAHPAAELVVRKTLVPLIEGRPVCEHPAIWQSMVDAVRNAGVEGIPAAAISAVDNALWDLRGKLMDVSLVDLLGRVRKQVPVYGSGGFTSYDEDRLVRQLEAWAADGIDAVKIKVGREPEQDVDRVHAARRAVGGDVRLMVDANNAYHPRQAVAWAHRFGEAAGVTWLEQPVPQEDIPGMTFVREHAPPETEIADGEYGYAPVWFLRRIEAGAADVLMPDITRCLGLTGFLQIAAICRAGGVPVSSHCAPALHATVGCVVSNLRDCEYFHDHARIEAAVFEGAAKPAKNGCIAPAADRPGFGLEFKRREAGQLARSNAGDARGNI